MPTMVAARSAGRSGGSWFWPNSAPFVFLSSPSCSTSLTTNSVLSWTVDLSPWGLGGEEAGMRLSKPPLKVLGVAVDAVCCFSNSFTVGDVFFLRSEKQVNVTMTSSEHPSTQSNRD